MKNKIKSYILKDDRKLIYIISFVLGFLLLFLLMNQVVMYADDFGLLLTSKLSFVDIGKYLINHYKNWGGGLTPLFVILVFQIGFNFWKVLNSLLITLMIFLISKLLSKNKKQYLLNFSLAWLLFYALSIIILRESVFWLDGSMAYVVSTFELFMYIYMLYTRFIQGISKKYDWILLPIIGLFSGWSSAQTSAVSLIITLGFIIYSFFIKKQKVTKKLLLFLIPSIIGSGIFFLSPGNSSRMMHFEIFNHLNLLDKILYRISNVANITFNYKETKFMAMPFYIYLFSYLILFMTFNYLKEEKNNKRKWTLEILAFISLIFLMVTLVNKFVLNDTIYNFTFNFENLYYLKQHHALNFSYFMPYILLFAFLFAKFIMVIYHVNKEKNCMLLILFIVIYGSQFSMLLAPYGPYRTCLTSVIFLIFAIIYLFNYLLKNKIDIMSLVPLMLFYINIYISIIFYLILDILKSKYYLQKIVIVLCLLPLVGVSLFNYKNLLIRYHENKVIYKENLKRLKNYDGIQKEIHLLKNKDPLYAFTPLIGVEWIENDIKNYFNIPNNIKFKYGGILR